MADLPEDLATLQTVIQQTRCLGDQIMRRCKEIGDGPISTMEVLFAHHCECLELIRRQIERDYLGPHFVNPKTEKVLGDDDE